MTQTDIVSGALLDEIALTLEEFARACEREPQWVVTYVEAEVITKQDAPTRWRFTSADLLRARRLAAVERICDANPDAAALMVDLMEEIDRLKGLLSVA